MKGRTARLVLNLVMGILLVGVNAAISDQSLRSWLNIALILTWALYIFCEIGLGLWRGDQYHSKEPTREELMSALEDENKTRSEKENKNS